MRELPATGQPCGSVPRRESRARAEGVSTRDLKRQRGTGGALLRPATEGTAGDLGMALPPVPEDCVPGQGGRRGRQVPRPATERRGLAVGMPLPTGMTSGRQVTVGHRSWAGRPREWQVAGTRALTVD